LDFEIDDFQHTALYQGTASAVPQKQQKGIGL